AKEWPLVIDGRTAVSPVRSAWTTPRSLSNQSAPIHIAMVTMKALTETSETTSCKRSVMELS
ncbi:hypothetical protein AB4144_32360, partial [Rhizobiaceae sp. 2RAB30]